MNLEMKSMASSAFFKPVAAIILSIASCSAVRAQSAVNTETVRPVVTTFSLGVGSSHIADTYLTPLKYSGWAVSLGYERWQVSRWGDGQWLNRIDAGGEFYRTLNHSRNGIMWSGAVHASWGSLRRWNVFPGVKAGLGPVAALDAGCVYNQRNSNNPASGRCAVTVGAAGYAAWNFKLARLPLTLVYQAETPVIGAFFSPRYDELYYEIYLGNHNGLAHVAWWGSRWEWRQQLSLDIPVGSSRLRLGYKGKWMSSRVNNLTVRDINHQAVIGFTTEWMSVKTASRHALRQAQVISALY